MPQHQVKHLALLHGADAFKAQLAERALDGFALRVEDAFLTESKPEHLTKGCSKKPGPNMELSTISAQEKTEIQAQIRVLGWPLLAAALIAYVAMIFGFSRASPAFISRVQSCFLNSPDFSKCAPLFSARVTAHIAFAHVVFLFCTFVYVVSLLSRWQAGHFAPRNHTRLFIPLVFILFAAVPVLSSNFLLFRVGRVGLRRRPTFTASESTRLG
jgi:hypothetical protein